MTSFDKGLFGIVALVIIVVAFSHLLQIDTNIVEKLVAFATGLGVYFVGKKTPQNM